ncbi:MAG: ABC transporter permease subunit [Alphaproteobacteria bacterium]|nr:ABC transporter permease subunit [Alphaproteobacteria bacterium]
METFFGSALDYDYVGAWAYITNGKHLGWYASVRWTLGAAILGAGFALFFGLAGAMMKRSRNMLIEAIGSGYVVMVRGVPDVLFLISFPLAFEVGIETLLAYTQCTLEERAGVLWPPCVGAQWALSDIEYFLMASVSLGLVYGAFCANVIYGALCAVPHGQIESAIAYGMTPRQILYRVHLPQMWVYALPGLSNVWLLLLKATSLLSLLQIADIVQWAERLGAPNYFSFAGLVHGDWRWRYYLVLFVFYILMTMVSEWGFSKLTRRVSRGMATQGGGDAG